MGIRYTRSISGRDLDNAKWHFHNNMKPIMQADKMDYERARADIAYLLELSTEEIPERDENGRQCCPRCSFKVKRKYCPEYGQALQRIIPQKRRRNP